MAGHTESPVELVGTFLNAVFESYLQAQTCFVEDVQVSTKFGEFAQPLYLCPNYSKMEFLCLILKVFSGVPRSYQLMRCNENTTEDELRLFLKRLEKYQAHYLIFDVNKLPFKLQEVKDLMLPVLIIVAHSL